MKYKKPSDNPLSPFNPNYKSDIDWSGFRKSHVTSEAVSKVVNDKRKQGKEMGTIHGISKKPPKGLIKADKLYVDMSVLEKKK